MVVLKADFTARTSASRTFRTVNDRCGVRKRLNDTAGASKGLGGSTVVASANLIFAGSTHGPRGAHDAGDFPDQHPSEVRHGADEGASG